MKTILLALSVSLLQLLPGFLPGLIAQDPPATTASQPFVLEAGEIKLNDLVDRCASHLKWNILLNDQEIAARVGNGAIRMQNRLQVDRNGCEDLLSSMLARSNFVLTVLDESQHLYEVISLDGPRAREISNRAVRRTPEEVLRRPSLRMPVTTVLELQHTNAVIATNALRPFLASSGPGQSLLTIGNFGNTRAIVISGLQDQVATAIGLVRSGDVPDPMNTVPGVTERLEAIERRLAALEKKLKAGEEK